MLTFDLIDACTPSLKISRSLALGLNIFAHASDITDEIALELLSPYPEGISDLTKIVILVFSSSDFGTDVSTTFRINRELRFDSLFSNIIPFPGWVSTVASMPSDISSVAPLPVAMAFTIDTAPCMLAFTFIIKCSQVGSISWLRMGLVYRSKSQMISLLEQEAFPTHI